MSPKQPKVNYSRNGERLDSDCRRLLLVEELHGLRHPEHRRSPHPRKAVLRLPGVPGPARSAGGAGRVDRQVRGAVRQGVRRHRNGAAGPAEELGIVGKDAVTFPRLPNIPAWDEVDQGDKRRCGPQDGTLRGHDRVHGRPDRPVDSTTCKKSGKYDNTLIVFISDNGAAGEDMARAGAQAWPRRLRTGLTRPSTTALRTGDARVRALTTDLPGARSAACRSACSRASWPRAASGRR